MRRAIAGIGRTLVTLGLLILLFVVYQLWGTGIFTARAQETLKKQLQVAQQQYNQENDTVAPPTTAKKPSKKAGTTTTTVHQDNVKPAPPTPPDGQGEGYITIPKAGLGKMAYVEGTSRDDLKKGPGHYPGTPLPGTIGNAAIAGHRTTYLHPFWGVDNLKVGDDIFIQTVAGNFDYQVSQPPFTVDPTDIAVVNNTLDAELTLTSCNPRGSASQRIVIKAKLVPSKSAKPAKARPHPATVGSGKSRVTEATGLADGLSGDTGATRSLVPSILWGIVAAIVGLGWWWTFRRWRHPATWLIGLVPFLVALFPFYVYLERALPAGY